MAKAAATLGRDAFHAVHDRLLHAYFAESRDVTAAPVLRAIWAEAGLPADALARADDPALLDATIADHDAAVDAGVTGVPAVMLEGSDTPLLGVHPLALWRRWILRALGRPGS